VRLVATTVLILVFSTGNAVPSSHSALAVDPGPQPPNNGALVWRSGTVTLRLTEEDCPYRELAADLECEGIPPAKAYVVDQESRRTIGCWTSDRDGDVITREPNGMAGTIPIDWFRRDPGRWTEVSSQQRIGDVRPKQVAVD